MLSINPIFIIFSCLFSFTTFSVIANANSVSWGKVNMEGAIIDTACAISVESREQTIDMGTIPIAEILRDGQGKNHKFSINLVNCILDREGKDYWKQFQVTFDGENNGRLFNVYGNASGIALQLSDFLGNTITPGKALPAIDIQKGEKKLNYSLRLVTDNHILKSGDYFSSIRFKIDYF
ncbi:UNVERIFIED_ORG: type 1 fimbria pilin [Providencia alcalifaciens]